MTMPETNSETTPDATVAPVAPPKTRNTLGLVALGLAVVGALFAVLPATNGFSWVLLLAGFIVAIIALTRKGQKKSIALIALIVSFLFWIISIFVGIAVVANAVSDSLSDSPSVSAPDAAVEDVAEEPAAEEAGIGDTVTNADGVEATLLSITPGAVSPDEYFSSEVRGTLVAVSMTMTNGSDEAVSISGSSVNGFIGEAEYEAARVYGTESGDWYVFEEINPGLTAAFTAYIDVPADTDLQTVSFTPEMFFGDGMVFLAK